MTFNEAEEKVKKYYDGIRVIRGLKYRLEVYEKRKADLENKINNSVIKLEDNYTAVSYDGIGGSLGGVKVSPQEKAVDRAFLVLEKSLEGVNAEILIIEEQISDIAAENSDIEYILQEMKPEYKEIIESLYKYEKGALKTSVDSNMDRATIYRKKDKVIYEVMKWLNFYN